MASEVKKNGFWLHTETETKTRGTSHPRRNGAMALFVEDFSAAVNSRLLCFETQDWRGQFDRRQHDRACGADGDRSLRSPGNTDKVHTAVQLKRMPGHTVTRTSRPPMAAHRHELTASERDRVKIGMVGR